MYDFSNFSDFCKDFLCDDFYGKLDLNGLRTELDKAKEEAKKKLEEREKAIAAEFVKMREAKGELGAKNTKAKVAEEKINTKAKAAPTPTFQMDVSVTENGKTKTYHCDSVDEFDEDKMREALYGKKNEVEVALDDMLKQLRRDWRIDDEDDVKSCDGCDGCADCKGDDVDIEVTLCDCGGDCEDCDHEGQCDDCEFCDDDQCWGCDSTCENCDCDRDDCVCDNELGELERIEMLEDDSEFFGKKIAELEMEIDKIKRVLKLM